MKQSEGFSKLVLSLLTVLAYGCAFYLLSLTLTQIPMGIAYAVWSGTGVVLITGVGWLLEGQKLDTPAITGMAFSVAGTVIMNVFSKTAPQ